MSYDDYYTTGGASYTDVAPYSIPMVTKFQAMFWIFAEALLVLLIGLRCLEKGNKASRILALIGLGFGAISLILQLALVWELFPVIESTGFFSYSLTAMGKITSFVSITMVAAICGALIMRIKENDKMVRILKLVSICCGAFLWLVEVIIIFSSDYSSISKIFSIAGVVSSCFIVSWITALIMSRFNRNDEKEGKKELTSEPVRVKPIQTKPVQTESIRVTTEPEPKPEIEPSQTLEQGNSKSQETPPEVNF